MSSFISLVFCSNKRCLFYLNNMTRLIRTFSMAPSVPVLACCRRSDSRAREENSRTVLRFYKTKRFAVFRNFRVISMRFAVFLCYSVRYLRVFLCGFAVLVPHLRPPQTLLFLTRLPTRQDGVQNRDKVYNSHIKCPERKFSFVSKINLLLT